MTSFRRSKAIHLDSDIHDLHIDGADLPPGGRRARKDEPKINKEELEKAFQRGLRMGNEQVMKELGKVIKVLSSAANGFERSSDELLRHNDEQVVILAIAIAQKILGRELGDAESLRSMMLRALSQAPTKTALKIRLNPRDLKSLEEHRQDFETAGHGLPEDVVLCPDASIASGGCVVEGPSGTVDARIETQLKLIEEVLKTGGETSTGDASQPQQ